MSDVYEQNIVKSIDFKSRISFKKFRASVEILSFNKPAKYIQINFVELFGKINCLIS